MTSETERKARKSPTPSQARQGFLRRLGSLVLQALVIGGITFAIGEVAARVLFDIQPLTSGDLVWQHHPRWGWAHRPGAEDTFVKLAARQQIHINSKGLREREIPYGKPAGVTRVLAIGDSNTAGFEVALEDVWTRVAERTLQSRGENVEFINAGTRGYGTDQSLLFLMDEGVKYSPDLVLYFWNDNDLGDNATVHRPFREYGKGYFDIDETGSLVLKEVPVPEFPYAQSLLVGDDGNTVELEVPFSVRLRIWVRDYVVAKSAFGAALVHVAVAIPQLASSVQEAGSFSQGGGARAHNRLFNVTTEMVREMHRVSCAAGAAFRFIVVGDQSREIARQAAVDELDPWVLFRDRVSDSTEVLVPFDTHFNERGHLVFGESVAAILARDDWRALSGCTDRGH